MRVPETVPVFLPPEARVQLPVMAPEFTDPEPETVVFPVTFPVFTPAEVIFRSPVIVPMLLVPPTTETVPKTVPAPVTVPVIVREENPEIAPECIDVPEKVIVENELKLAALVAELKVNTQPNPNDVQLFVVPLLKVTAFVPLKTAAEEVLEVWVKAAVPPVPTVPGQIVAPEIIRTPESAMFTCEARAVEMSRLLEAPISRRARDTIEPGGA